MWEWKSSVLKSLPLGLLQPPCDYNKVKENQVDFRAIELTLEVPTPDVLLFKKNIFFFVEVTVNEIFFCSLKTKSIVGTSDLSD